MACGAGVPIGAGDVRILMDAGPWLAVPPRGYGGLENVVATLTTELRRRGHRVVLATVGDSTLPADGQVSAFPTGQFPRLAGPYPAVVGVAHAHEQAVLAAIRRHSAAGEPFDVVHTHVEVVGSAVLGASGPAGPPVLATLHWDLHRNADFHAAFDGRGHVFFAGVSAAQLARAPERLLRQTLGAVPLSVVPSRHPRPATDAERRPDVVALGRITPLKGTAVAVRAAQRAGLPIVLAGPVAGCPDRGALHAGLADPASELHRNQDVRYYLDEVAPLLDGRSARWIGTVAGEAKDALLRYARAAVFPIDWEEPGGTALCEALAAGTPVVAMARGCVPSLVDHGVTGFLAEDEAGFVDALRRLGELDPRACMAAAGERFAPAVMAAAYERLYATAISRASAASAGASAAEAPAEVAAGSLAG
jgi:glycosyltransferase involved in cell wall biosynthesis